MGLCEDPPKICPKTTAPVCGCDGVSYRNECMMRHVGVSLDHPGLCCAQILCLVGEPIDTDGDGCDDLCPPPMTCEGPSPAGCKNTGCEDGDTCTFGVECTASICFCDASSGLWNCTKDCGGGTCVSDDLCADFVPPGCPEEGCGEGYVCGTTLECVPSACGCSPETGDIWCTADCGGGTCVPGEPVDPCADYVPPGCVQAGCGEGLVCDTTVGCVPSSCGCEPDTGQIWCTDDCVGGTCVPEQTGGTCEEPNPQGCKNTGCDEGATCEFDIACTPSTCNCSELDDGFHWNCTKDCGGGICVPDDLAAGCCMGDGHCGDDQLCVNAGVNSIGVCKLLPPPASPGVACWSDDGCPDEQTCEGVILCPCGVVCVAPDQFGMCAGAGGGDPTIPPAEE